MKEDLQEKIVLLSGPRQVGKTTLARQLFEDCVYLNYDAVPDRLLIQKREWSRKTRLIIFDELHKMRGWKSWIKGLFDTEGKEPSLLVTGSAKLDAFRKGGDSLAGRFFHHRLHPLTLKEIAWSMPELNAGEALARLLALGGFPEPFIKNNETYAKRWRRTHLDMIVRGDLLDLERVRDVHLIETLIEMLKHRVGSTVSFASLARDLQVSLHTVRHWLQILESLYVIFPVRPYSRNIARSLLKEPKYYFYDTGAVEGGSGPRLENLVAHALLRELHLFEDQTGSRISLHYLRDKEKREVDFLAVADGRPKLLIEVKTADDQFSPALFHFRRFLPEIRVVQVVQELGRVKEKDGVEMVPADRFLAELAISG